MSTKKRNLEEGSSTPKSKKQKLALSGGKPPKAHKVIPSEPTVPSALSTDEIDFPRGGGTSFTPLEYKVIRAEAVKEADDEVFKDAEVSKKSKPNKKKAAGASTPRATSSAKATEKGTVRVEHLNYKRMVLGMKVLCQIISVQPLALIVSLPNQLLGHVPITQITSQLTALLESMDDDDDDESQGQESTMGGDVDGALPTIRAPDLFELFRPGEYVRAVVTALKPSGTSNTIGIGHARDAVEKGSRRVELSIAPEHVNAGVLKADLRPDFTLTAAVKSTEDHGYALDLGVPDVSGFLPSKDAKKGPFTGTKKLHVGGLINVRVTKMSENGRICTVSSDDIYFKSISISEVTNVSSVLPGTLVQSLITAVVPSGLNVQLLGYFAGTIDLFHIPSHDFEDKYKVGQKVKARVLYDVQGTTPPQFSLSLLEHVTTLDVKRRYLGGGVKEPVQESFPIGAILQSAKVVRVESERGLVVEVAPGVDGHVHISHVSDDHVPSLSSTSGPWRLNTLHRARVTGYHPLDGLLQLSLRSTVLEQKFLQVGDVHVGEVIKGTVKKLSDTGLFVSVSGNVDGVVWPNHFADIILKRPQQRFKPGGSINCRVLTVDPERKRIVLTAKKTLVESELPIITKFEDAKIGMVTHGVVSRVYEKSLSVEFYGNVRAIVSAKEASDVVTGNLSDSFAVGKPVKVRILSVDMETSRIFASIRQAAAILKDSVDPVGDIDSVEIGKSVSGVVSAIHKDNVVLTLQPSKVRALISVHNLANHRGASVDELRKSLKPDEKLQELVVVTRNPEKGFVIVASRPISKTPFSKNVSWEKLQVSQRVVGRVGRHGRRGATVHLSGRIFGSLHPTDVCDDYGEGNAFPSPDSTVNAVVLDLDRQKKLITLSTRSSRVAPDSAKPVVDREISSVLELQTGEKVRGFIKGVADHGLFISLGRNIDARVQIKELFDQYVKDWKSGFQINQLVEGRIISVNVDKNQIEMSFRSGDITTSAKSSLTLSDLCEGQKVEGRVKKVEEYGLFIEIDNSKLSGLCHKSQIADNKDADTILALRSFKDGDRVKAVILSIDSERRRISLGLKPSYFAEEDFAGDSSNGDEDVDAAGNQQASKVEDDAEDIEVDDEAELHGSPAPSENQGSDDDGEDLMDVELVDAPSFAQTKALGGIALAPVTTAINLKGGFRWNGQEYNVNDAGLGHSGVSSDEESESEGEQSSKKKRKRRKEIEQDFTADMHTKTPESTADFERHLLGSPDSSYMWIQYMSFQLQLSEIDKAREIGKRATQTITFREEQERLNAWIALLNLENTYGTDETLDAMFKDAARHNDSKTVHLRLASILEQSEKHQKAEDQFKRTCKKFGQSSKVWTLFGEHYLRRGELEKARALLPRSLQSLQKRKHLKTISKFAQMEYKLGDPERGKTIFEGIVDLHPKRWDLWSVYMDMEAFQKNIQSLRNIFDRVLALKMTSHKAKSFFKKWLDLENRIGDEAGAGIVKEKAIEWTQRAAGASS